jgi:hypothetical protein
MTTETLKRIATNYAVYSVVLGLAQRDIRSGDHAAAMQRIDELRMELEAEFDNITDAIGGAA